MSSFTHNNPLLFINLFRLMKWPMVGPLDSFRMGAAYQKDQTHDWNLKVSSQPGKKGRELETVFSHVANDLSSRATQLNLNFKSLIRASRLVSTLIWLESGVSTLVLWREEVALCSSLLLVQNLPYLSLPFGFFLSCILSNIIVIITIGLSVSSESF